MDKINLLATTGRLEIVFQNNEPLLKELKELQNSVFGDDLFRSAVSFGRLSKMAEYAGLECGEEFKALYDNLSDIGRVNADGVANIAIEDLDFSVRTFNVLKRAGLNTVGDIAKKSEADLAKLRSITKTCLNEILDKTKELGIVLKKV